MKTVFPLFAAGLMVLAGCNNKAQEVAPQGTPAIDLANLDSTTTANADFYQYACGGWMKAHPLTAEYSRFGTIDMVFENNNKQLKELVEGLMSTPQTAGSVGEKMANYMLWRWIVSRQRRRRYAYQRGIGDHPENWYQIGSGPNGSYVAP